MGTPDPWEDILSRVYTLEHASAASGVLGRWCGYSTGLDPTAANGTETVFTDPPLVDTGGVVTVDGSGHLSIAVAGTYVIQMSMGTFGVTGGPGNLIGTMVISDAANQLALGDGLSVNFAFDGASGAVADRYGATTSPPVDFAPGALPVKTFKNGTFTAGGGWHLVTITKVAEINPT